MQIFRALATRQSAVPATHVLVEGVREFTIVVTLPQFAFRGSHRLELYLDQVLVGEVSVFSRLQPDKFKNCVGRIAAGHATVRGVIRLPHDIVLNVLERSSLNKPDTSDDVVAQVIKDHLVAKIFRPNKTELAWAEPKGLTGDVSTSNHRRMMYSTVDGPRLVHSPIEVSSIRSPVLEQNRSPTLELHSALLYVSRNRMLPMIFDDWKSHGTVLENEWAHSPRNNGHFE